MMHQNYQRTRSLSKSGQKSYSASKIPQKNIHFPSRIIQSKEAKPNRQGTFSEAVGNINVADFADYASPDASLTKRGEVYNQIMSQRKNHPSSLLKDSQIMNRGDSTERFDKSQEERSKIFIHC
mgnify:CR=1 FL=1